jgi:hypothetical protein
MYIFSTSKHACARPDRVTASGRLPQGALDAARQHDNLPPYFPDPPMVPPVIIVDLYSLLGHLLFSTSYRFDLTSGSSFVRISAVLSACTTWGAFIRLYLLRHL